MDGKLRPVSISVYCSSLCSHSVLITYCILFKMQNKTEVGLFEILSCSWWFGVFSLLKKLFHRLYKKMKANVRTGIGSGLTSFGRVSLSDHVKIF